MSNPPTLILVPGAWHKPACYDEIIKILHETYKLKCVAVTLPSASDNPNGTLKNDIDVVREAMTREFRKGRDVVLVAHSYGGMVANSAIKGFNKPQGKSATQSTSLLSAKIKAQTTGHVVGLILIASGFTLTGLAFMDLFRGHPPPFWRINKNTGYAELTTSTRQLFYHDVPEEEAEYWVSQLTNQSLKSLFEGGEHAYAGWLDVPVWYLGTSEDQGNPVVAQRMQIGMAREMGADVQHRELQTSHSPFLSQPQETAQVVLDAVEAFTGKPVVAAKSSSSKRVRQDNALLPVPRLWQPATWFRAIFDANVAFMVLITIVIAARMYVRAWAYKQVWWDDCTMVIGATGTLAMCALDLIVMRHGGGLVLVDGPDSDPWEQKRISILFVKLSILLFYIRVFFPIGVSRKGTFWWLIQGVIWMNVLYTISIVTAVAVQCVPYGRPWGNVCMNTWLVLVFASSINTVSDFAVLLIPVGSVWKLQMSRSKKWAAVSLFAFGTLAPFASITRLVYQIAMAESKDVTVIYLVVAVFATTEQVIGIIVGCLPVMSFWLMQLKRKMRAERNGLHTASQRLRRDWQIPTGSRDRRQRQHVGGRDPYHVTDATIGSSQEILYSSLGNERGCERANESMAMTTLPINTRDMDDRV
ncbi:hypothetical protein PG993_013614 [Apiospora rasikravindrae]|uniref:AB hydrolase-1 domain-containing protein n=1 Tax=Apiospora rasikravindrae TaxID=990691 RepID=A0ABR1RY46_9PEZI